MTNTIASERKRLNMTQADLGRELGKDRATIGRWESDASHVEAEYLFKLAKLFQCSVDYLLGITQERTPQGVTQIG